MDILYNYCAGLDFHKDSVAVCALRVDEHGESRRAGIRTFGTMACWSCRTDWPIASLLT